MATSSAVQPSIQPRWPKHVNARATQVFSRQRCFGQCSRTPLWYLLAYAGRLLTQDGIVVVVVAVVVVIVVITITTAVF